MFLYFLLLGIWDYFSRLTSNSKYAFLGAYVLLLKWFLMKCLLVYIISVLLCKVNNLYQIVITSRYFFYWHCWYLWPSFYHFFFLALSWNESSSFWFSWSRSWACCWLFCWIFGNGFALFFLGEYSNMLVMCSLIVLFFWWLVFAIAVFQFPIWFGIKVAIFSFWFVWVRATYPRLAVWSTNATRVKIISSYFSWFSSCCC